MHAFKAVYPGYDKSFQTAEIRSHLLLVLCVETSVAILASELDHKLLWLPINRLDLNAHPETRSVIFIGTCFIAVLVKHRPDPLNRIGEGLGVAVADSEVV